MKTYPILRDDGSLLGFEITSPKATDMDAVLGYEELGDYVFGKRRD